MQPGSFMQHIAILITVHHYGLALSSCAAALDDATAPLQVSLLQTTMHVHHSGAPSEKPLEEQADGKRKSLIQDEANVHAGDDQTALTQSLNSMLATSSQGVYKGGHGVVVRTLDDGAEFGRLMDTLNGVVPTTLLSNDILAPSTMYPSTSGWDFDEASVGVVIGSKFSTLWIDGDHIQDSGWDNGVFYGTDANSADHRCRWLEQDKGYDCLGGWLPQGGNFQEDASFLGSGSYPSGNPHKNLGGGGGAGCHFDHRRAKMDQYGAVGTSLVKDKWCECNSALNGNNWQDWVHQWILNGKQADKHLSAISSRLNPTWTVDLAACWVSNPRDMIHISNAMWLLNDKWYKDAPPEYSTFMNHTVYWLARRYWGWNEVPLDRAKVDNANNWDAIVIKLPAAACGRADGMRWPGNGGQDDRLDCLSHKAQVSLESVLEWYVQNNHLKLGSSNSMKKPGSSVVLLKEYYTGKRSWNRYFFCQSWTSPNKTYSIVFEKQGGCFLDQGPITLGS